jgi:DNA-binding NtrC family response regulator
VPPILRNFWNDDRATSCRDGSLCASGVVTWQSETKLAATWVPPSGNAKLLKAAAVPGDAVVVKRAKGMTGAALGEEPARGTAEVIKLYSRRFTNENVSRRERTARHRSLSSIKRYVAALRRPCGAIERAFAAASATAPTLAASRPGRPGGWQAPRRVQAAPLVGLATRPRNRKGSLVTPSSAARMPDDGMSRIEPSSTTAPTSSERRDFSNSSVAVLRPGLVRLYPDTKEGAPSLWAVARPLVCGRSQLSAVRLDDSCASRAHARVEPATNGLRVVDVGSRHGTWLDGELVSDEGRLASWGSILRIGETLLLVTADVEAHRAPLRRLAPEFLGTRRAMIAGPTLLRTWDQASRSAALKNPVLISGETGAGKEAIARLIHSAYDRSAPFVALNVAAIPEGLFESELFGHTRGAFTGASSERIGAFREAKEGILFLDEIGDLRLDSQAKLLRAIDEMRIRPLGSTGDVSVRARIVAATSRDLQKASEEGRFRQDLYYRLAGLTIEVPPLRRRREEILAIAQELLETESAELKLGPDAAEVILLAPWRGNVRELGHVLARAALEATLSARVEIIAADLPGPGTKPKQRALGPHKAKVEAALRLSKGNASLAAKSLGVSRSTIYNLFKRYGMNPGSRGAGAD